MRAFQAHRKQTQPAGASLGSIFKNPPGDYAGRLIEAAGLKGYHIGGAAVSAVHANFFINSGGAATASDYHALVRHVQATVDERFGIALEPEIEFIGEFES
jgi:UDP-N-acetylmuramate dehydrogenase